MITKHYFLENQKSFSLQCLSMAFYRWAAFLVSALFPGWLHAQLQPFECLTHEQSQGAPNYEEKFKPVLQTLKA